MDSQPQNLEDLRGRLCGGIGVAERCAGFAASTTTSTWRTTCRICKGKGKVKASGKMVECRNCAGKGSSLTSVSG
jgi:DnaJ-class molecular chaperone